MTSSPKKLPGAPEIIDVRLPTAPQSSLPAVGVSEFIAELTTQDPAYQRFLDNLSEEKRQRITNSVNRMTTGLHATAPIMCKGPRSCLFVEWCPIPPRDDYGAIATGPDGEPHYGPDTDYPRFQQCVLERQYMRQRTLEYFQYLQVDPQNPIEMSIVNELAVIDLLKNRALMILAKGDKRGQGRDFMRVDVTGYGEGGDPSESTSLHPAADYIDRLERRREKWLDKLVETRKAKVDAAAKLGGMSKDSELLTELQAVREALAAMAEQAQSPGGSQRLLLEADDEEIVID